MIYPSLDELAEKVGSRYALVIAVAKRARQLKDGATPLVESKSTNPITIALEEIAAGKLNIHIPTPEEQAAREEVVAPRERERELAEAVDLLKAPVEEESTKDQGEAERTPIESEGANEPVQKLEERSDKESAEATLVSASEEEEREIVEE